jgi:hypothetical protein
MTDEQEIKGASNNAADAPSLEASRGSPRRRVATQRAIESRAQEQASPPQSRKRKRGKATFEVFADPPSPPPTQLESQSTQGTFQVGTDPSTSQKKRRKSKRKGTNDRPRTPEEWEVNFNAATTADAKLQVLLESLGHEDFPNRLRIPERKTEANITVKEADPMNPLLLWQKFISTEILQVIADHTNENEALRFETTPRTDKGKERTWHDVTAADIGAFIGAAMLMAIHPQKNVSEYWNCSEDKPIFPLQKYFSRQRFQQIARFLKVNSPSDNDVGAEFWLKLEPLMSSFREACQSLVSLGDTVSIDENLIMARSRTEHLMQIDNKIAGKGYKLYTLALHYYLYDWMYTSKKSKVKQAKNYIPRTEGFEDDAFTDTERMVLTLVEQLLTSHPELKFIIVFDNFFTSTRLFEELRSWGVGAYGTAKAGSGMPAPHIVIDKVATKERHYGEVANTVGKGVNFVTYVDNGAVWMMSTVHDVANQPQCWRDVKTRSKPSVHLARQSINGELEIPYPQISQDYNHHMNGSDLCQQVWNSQSTRAHRHRRNWWPLFWQLIDASVANVLYLYRLKGFSESQLSHHQVQERLALQLLRNPAAVTRVVDPVSLFTTWTRRPTQLRRPTDEHQWTRGTKRYCAVHGRDQFRKRGKGKTLRARRALEELGNYNTTWSRPPDATTGPRKRGKQTTWACLQCQLPLCRDGFCWDRHHHPEDYGQGNDREDGPGS